MLNEPKKMSVFEKFIETRQLTPPKPDKATKRTLGNPMVASAAQAVYDMPDANAPTQAGAGGMQEAMGTNGAWGKPK